RRAGLDSAPELVPRLRSTGFDQLRIRLTDTLQDRFIFRLDLVAVCIDVLERRKHLLLAQTEILGDLRWEITGAFIIDQKPHLGPSDSICASSAWTLSRIDWLWGWSFAARLSDFSASWGWLSWSWHWARPEMAPVW